VIALLLALALATPVRALAEKVEAELDAWDLQGAGKALDELVQHHPDSAEAGYFRGRILFEQGRYEEAAKAYAEAETRGAGKGAVLLAEWLSREGHIGRTA